MIKNKLAEYYKKLYFQKAREAAKYKMMLLHVQRELENVTGS